MYRITKKLVSWRNKTQRKEVTKPTRDPSSHSRKISRPQVFPLSRWHRRTFILIISPLLSLVVHSLSLSLLLSLVYTLLSMLSLPSLHSIFSHYGCKYAAHTFLTRYLTRTTRAQARETERNTSLRRAELFDVPLPRVIRPASRRCCRSSSVERELIVWSSQRRGSSAS